MKYFVLSLASIVVIAAAACSSGGESVSPSASTATVEVTSASLPATASPEPATATPEPPTPTLELPTPLPPAPTLPQPTAVQALVTSSTINLQAKNIAFSPTSARARSGTAVTVIFNNLDTSVPHDLSFGRGGQATIYAGTTCSGPCSQTFSFIAPAAGSYQFFCTVHVDMVGTFIVDP